MTSVALSCRAPLLLTKRTFLPLRQATRRPVHPAQPRLAPVVHASKDMGAAFSSSSSPDFLSMIQEKNAENPVIVYSKTYCPYCGEVKSLFQRLNVPHKVVELDNLADGTQVQAALSRLTGRNTVPQVFVGNTHVGGCDDTMTALDSGKLKELLAAAGISVSV